MEVRVVRLVTGEMLLGELTNQTDSVYTLKNPVMIGMGVDQAGKIQINMMQYMPFVKVDVFHFDKIHVMHVLQPNDGLAQTYRNKFSAVLMPAQPQLLL